MAWMVAAGLSIGWAGFESLPGGRRMGLRRDGGCFIAHDAAASLAASVLNKDPHADGKIHKSDGMAEGVSCARST